MKPTLNSTKNEVSGCKPVVIGEDHACYYGGFLCLNDGHRLVWVEAQEVLAKIALAEVEV